jgi:hypothetical protein
MSLKVKSVPTQRAPDPRPSAPGLAWWDCRPWARRARFQAVCVT